MDPRCLNLKYHKRAQKLLENLEKKNSFKTLQICENRVIFLKQYIKCSYCSRNSASQLTPRVNKDEVCNTIIAIYDIR